MANSLCGDDAYQTRTVDPWDEISQYAPTPGYFGHTPACLFCPSPSPDYVTDQVQSDQLDFLPLAKWDEGAKYEKQYICYKIAWKPVFDRKKVGGVTEKDLVIAPRDYWAETLKPAVEEMLQKKRPVSSI
ncbi:hypothetical protein N7510_004375 [Penicillium lagena]|uniref:uncharacterized protein n=1 Tax=Penicillium lagena TaxID=94218 RepID=UPI00253F6D2A|nr:uncharacterized protein N7510_004375 [Penicillium lagena]KAJ5620391.1 hypothetical protein N7510_004375 [Penicillium lagena]